ncbi:MAG TPA: hypothetical protein VGM05_33195 [Planctomycetaceae bacterium]|jgi:hypothetical protein
MPTRINGDCDNCGYLSGLTLGLAPVPHGDCVWELCQVIQDLSCITPAPVFLTADLRLTDGNMVLTVIGAEGAGFTFTLPAADWDCAGTNTMNWLNDFGSACHLPLAEGSTLDVIGSPSSVCGQNYTYPYGPGYYNQTFQGCGCELPKELYANVVWDTAPDLACTDSPTVVLTKTANNVYSGISPTYHDANFPTDTCTLQVTITCYVASGTGNTGWVGDARLTGFAFGAPFGCEFVSSGFFGGQGANDYIVANPCQPFNGVWPEMVPLFGCVCGGTTGVEPCQATLFVTE